MKPGPTDVTYTKWERVFAWLPKKTVGGEKIWLKYLYKRNRMVEWTPPQFPPKAFDRVEYETIEMVLMRRLSGEN